MKTIAVILTIYNPDILTQADLDPYNTSNIKFGLHYIDTDLREITTIEQANNIQPLVIAKAHQQKQNGAAAVVIYTFGEQGFKALKKTLGIPVKTLGTVAIKQASAKAIKKFTILSGCLSHNDFWQSMIKEAKLEHNYMQSVSAPEITPAQIRKDPMIIEKLAIIARHEINVNNVDNFTLGCGSFIGIADQLEAKLQQEFGPSIHVIDPIKVTFAQLQQEIS